LLGAVSEFKQRGKSGLRISDAIPNIAQHA
jgi:hypothetical protein